MNRLLKILYFGLGISLSINQGITMLVGQLRNGRVIGADVLMPVDIPIYLLFLLQQDRSKETKVWLPIFITKLLVLVFYLLSITGEFIAYDNGEFRLQMVHLTRGVLIFFLIASRLNDKQYLSIFVKGLLSGLGIQSLIGFWQWQIGPVSIPYFRIDQSYRVSGLIGVPNAFGAYLITLLPLAIRVIFFTNMKPKLLWVAIALWSVGSLYATYTRGAWLAFVGVIVLFSMRDVWSQKIKRSRKIAFIALGLLFAVFIGVKYGGNITYRMQGATESLTGDETQSRMSLAKDALRIINENKVFGVGLNNYRHHASHDTRGLKMVHNAYLLIAAEQGIPAVSLFILAHIIAMFLGFRLLKSRDNLIFNVGIGTLSGYIALLVYHMIAPDYRLVGVLMQHWRLLGMLLGLNVMMEITERQSKLARIQYQKRLMKIKGNQSNPQNGKKLVSDETGPNISSGNIRIN